MPGRAWPCLAVSCRVLSCLGGPEAVPRRKPSYGHKTRQIQFTTEFLFFLRIFLSVTSAEPGGAGVAEHPCRVLLAEDVSRRMYLVRIYINRVRMKDYIDLCFLVFVLTSLDVALRASSRLAPTEHLRRAFGPTLGTLRSP